MSGIFDNIVKTVKDKAAAVKAGSQETDSIGPELKARAEMNRIAESALSGSRSATDSVKPSSDARPGNEPYGSRSGEKRIDTSKYHSPNIKTYDKGGKVNVNDGKHEVAILKHGERVLTEKQDKEYQKMKAEHGSDKDGDQDADCYDEGGKVHTPEEKAHFHRAMSHLNAGGLHRHLGIDEDKPIPLSKKQEAANSDNPHVAAMGRMAVAMHGWNHTKK